MHSMLPVRAHLVVQFQTSKHGVIESDVHAHNVVDDGVGLVGLQGGGDGEPGGRVPVHDVHQLLLLHGPDHGRPALGVHGQILPGDDPPATTLAKRLLVHLKDVE